MQPEMMEARLRDLEARVRGLESWANREAIRRGTLGLVAERLFSEQLASLQAEDAERILAELSNPYSFNLAVSASMTEDEAFKRTVTNAAIREIEDVVESLRKRSAEIRVRRSTGSAAPQG